MLFRSSRGSAQGMESLGPEDDDDLVEESTFRRRASRSLSRGTGTRSRGLGGGLPDDLIEESTPRSSASRSVSRGTGTRSRGVSVPGSSGAELSDDIPAETASAPRSATPAKPAEEPALVSERKLQAQVQYDENGALIDTTNNFMMGKRHEVRLWTPEP